MRTWSRKLVMIAVTIVLVTVAALTVSTWLGLWHPDASDPTVGTQG